MLEESAEVVYHIAHISTKERAELFVEDVVSDLLGRAEEGSWRRRVLHMSSITMTALPPKRWSHGFSLVHTGLNIGTWPVCHIASGALKCFDVRGS